ncbi:DUF2764 family protein [Neptuniibacter sp. QD34_54]|uniref:DUF2764 family protein n=1 Tax=unclassified Neptuniibacter TaxID=2630693 RepID=UPI0039F73A0B
MSGYYTLITALPWLPDLEQCKQLPLSRIALDQRLTMLSDIDRQQLTLIERLYYPNEQALRGLTDKEVVHQWMDQLEQVSSEVLRQRVLFHLELRTLMAALRSRSAGMENSALFYGVGRWLPRIRKHWFEPGFGLEEVCPQLQSLQRVLAKEDALLVEQTLNQWLWQDLAFCEKQHGFGFEALACFVLRWSIAERHLNYDAEAALTEFNRVNIQLLEMTGLEQQLAQGEA